MLSKISLGISLYLFFLENFSKSSKSLNLYMIEQNNPFFSFFLFILLQFLHLINEQLSVSLLLRQLSQIINDITTRSCKWGQ